MKGPFIFLIAIAVLVCAALFATGYSPPATSDDETTFTKQTTTPATATVSTDTPAPVIEQAVAIGNYARRVTPTVARLDANWDNVRLPEAPSFEIGHVPLV